MTAELYLDCPVCGQERPAELPDPADAHADELMCVDCGAAVFLDPVTAPVRRATAA